MKGDNIANTNVNEDNSFVKKAWHQILVNGNEIGNHTYSHSHGVEIDWDKMTKKDVFTVEDWKKEINLCTEWLTKPYKDDVKKDDESVGIGAKKEDIIGFRTPFLECNDATYTALKDLGFQYEAALEEGWQPFEDGTNYVWPFTLDNGAPGEAYTAKNDFEHDPFIGKHPGLWEMPAYALVVPSDKICKEYGIKEGFRARMKKTQDYFNEENPKITGLDWNLWFEYYMSKAEFVGIMKYNIDLRLKGNRAPFIFGCHSDIYSSKYNKLDMEGEDTSKLNATVEERRAALKEVMEYALSKPEARLTSMKNILEWLKKPEAIK